MYRALYRNNIACAIGVKRAYAYPKPTLTMPKILITLTPKITVTVTQYLGSHVNQKTVQGLERDAYRPQRPRPQKLRAVIKNAIRMQTGKRKPKNFSHISPECPVHLLTTLRLRSI